MAEKEIKKMSKGTYNTLISLFISVAICIIFQFTAILDYRRANLPYEQGMLVYHWGLTLFSPAFIGIGLCVSLFIVWSNRE